MGKKETTQNITRVINVYRVCVVNLKEEQQQQPKKKKNLNKIFFFFFFRGSEMCAPTTQVRNREKELS